MQVTASESRVYETFSSMVLSSEVFMIFFRAIGRGLMENSRTIFVLRVPDLAGSSRRVHRA